MDWELEPEAPQPPPTGDPSGAKGVTTPASVEPVTLGAAPHPVREFSPPQEGTRLEAWAQTQRELDLSEVRQMAEFLRIEWQRLQQLRQLEEDWLTRAITQQKKAEESIQGLLEARAVGQEKFSKELENWRGQVEQNVKLLVEFQERTMTWEDDWKQTQAGVRATAASFRNELKALTAQHQEACQIAEARLDEATKAGCSKIAQTATSARAAVLPWIWLLLLALVAFLGIMVWQTFEIQGAVEKAHSGPQVQNPSGSPKPAPRR